MWSDLITKADRVVYFVTCVFSFFLNIVSTKLQHKTENRLIGFDAFDLQETKRVRQIFIFRKHLYFITFYDNNYILSFASPLYTAIF